MIDQTKRIRELFKNELNRLKLGDVVGFAVEGPQYVPSPQGITMGWVLLITLKHNILIGQPDLGVTVPVMGVLPPDEIFRKGAEYILEEARKLRREASQLPAEGAEGNGVPDMPGLPPGLTGKGLGGLIAKPGG